MSPASGCRLSIAREITSEVRTRPHLLTPWAHRRDTFSSRAFAQDSLADRFGIQGQRLMRVFIRALRLRCKMTPSLGAKFEFGTEHQIVPFARRV
jgi:hypothetical protein